MKKKKKLAFVYDVDGTLVPGDIPDYKLIPSMGMTPREFWTDCQNFSQSTGCEDILAYMHQLVEFARKNKTSLSRDFLVKMGQGIPTFNGVNTWFTRINAFAAEHDVEIEHYVVSAGLLELIESASFAPMMKRIFASEYIYKDGCAVWPKRAVNHTFKTQFIFRISKGLIYDINSQDVNERCHDHPIPFKQMVFIGDGMSDIPAMTVVQERGGKSIAVYAPGNLKKKELTRELMVQGRVAAAVPADYSDGSPLDVAIKQIVCKHGGKFHEHCK
jgi:phosphoserine phosphatase